MQVRNRGGFTAIELMIFAAIIAVLAIVVCYYLLFIPILCGNFYFTEDGVLRELKVDHPQATEILKVKRNVLNNSIITVKESGERKSYGLDTNILFNYKFEPAE